MQNLKNFLKETLKKRRMLANLSQEELAEKINISQVGYSKIECGKNLPSLITYLNLATELDFDMNELKKVAFEKR